ncbi:cyclic nucleotide-gated cation channel alpha-3-like isoform X6 [Lineus longissimus]|uniref:cyclic nucleotide-gated cation channel alpha-3-like isoform X6 n=1 Tax=Lineus longissimus TaxID=88925 RepID=UPI00315D7B87
MMETAAYNTNNPTYNSNQTPPQSAISENQTVKRNGGVPNIENHHVTYEPELPPPDEIKPDLEIRRRSSTINDTVRKSSGTGDDMIIPVESSQTSIKEETIPDSDKCDLIQSTGSKGWSKLRTTVKATSVVTEPVKKKRRQSNLQRQDSFLKRFSTRQGVSNDDDDDTHNDEKRATKVSSNGVQFEHRHSVVIHPVENVMFVWLAIITCAVLYNCWSIILRQAFPDIQSASSMAWFISDGLCDFIYICDIVVQLRTGFLEKGLLVYDSKKLALHYIKSQPFILDLVCLIPLDVIQFGIGIMPILRIPRLIKAYRWWRWKNMVESRTMYPNMWRVVNLTHMLFLLCHWFAGFYFLISTAEGFQGDWAYPTPVGEYANPIRKYLKSMYWATLTLTTIGDLPPPDTNWEWLDLVPRYWYVFTIVSYLIGVFFFATIVGQVGNVITNRNANRLEFERLLDGAKNYMRNHNVPGDMQRRVQRWYDYAWSRGRVNGGGGDINSLGLLPDKLKTELALHVNLSTLKKVTIFQECQPEFLHDLVLKMRAYIFTPGDLVCRKGEVAREMFIIADGILEVISDTGEVLTQMGAGDFFGEIGILNLDGGVNRRTADVRSVGYSELFTLSREDVLNALTDHPEAEELLTDYGRKRLQGLRQIAPVVVENNNSLISISGENKKEKIHGMTSEEAHPSPVTDLLGCPIDRSIRDKVDDDDNGIELRALGDKRDDRVRLNRSETKETQLTVPKKSFVHPSSSSSREDIVSEIMSEFKGVLISKLKSTDSHLVKKVNDLETLNTSQAQRIRELELKIEALQRLVTAISTCEYIDASPPSSNSYEPEHSDDQSHNAAATRTRIQVTRI